MQFWTGHFRDLFADSSCVVVGGDVLDWQEITSVVRAMKRMRPFIFLTAKDFCTYSLFHERKFGAISPS
jgi:hypothetical protein